MSISATNESVLSAGRCQERLDALALFGHVAVGAQVGELVGVRRLRLLVGDRDRGKAVGALGRSVLEGELASVRKQHVDDDTLGRC